MTCSEKNISLTCEIITVDGSRFTQKNSVHTDDPDKIDFEDAALDVFKGIKDAEATSIVNDDGSVTVLETKYVIGMTLKIDKKGK
jgi:hypothetical protein